MNFTREQKRECAYRELAMRRRVYPRRVAEGRMTQQEMDHEIACMQAIAEDYAEPNLFSVSRAGDRDGR